MENKYYSDTRYEEENEKFNKPFDLTGDVCWVYAIQKGRWVNCGKFASEAEATDFALKNLAQYQWEIFKTSTRDINEVQRRWKAHVLEMEHDLGKATETISRKPANEQKKKAEEEFF